MRRIALIIVCAACIGIMGAGAVYGDQTSRFVHVEHIGGGIHRVDYVEYVSGEEIVTCYYAYQDAQRPLRVTSVDVCNGSRYADATAML